MKLQELLRGLTYTFENTDGKALSDREEIERAQETWVSDVVNDSRKLSEGCLFICISGMKSDGHDYAAEAVRKGAAAILISHDVNVMEEAAQTGSHPVLIRVPDTRYAMAFVSAAWYGHPAERMKLIGVTGTKGKTTTTYMIRSILERAGIRTGLIGTIETLYEGHSIPSANMTPESIVLQKTFRDMADCGVQAVVMEVSSQALKLHRTQGFVFDLGIFTNLSPDHIGEGEHKDFDEYLECKSRLFRQCRVGIVNGDDPHCDEILKESTCEVERFGTGGGNDLIADNISLVHTPGELGVQFDVHGLVEMHAHVPAPGRFSVYNALCAIAVCRHFGVDASDIGRALAGIHVKGRIEMVKVSDSFTLLIDYAHNAMALESLLTTLREYHPHRLVTAFGCGGNRDRNRRFEMGEVSGRLSDLSIITSDNPRFEKPLDIIADILTGIQPTGGAYVEIPDRKEAIAYAIDHGEPGDIIILAGKGHEDYQEICGVKHPMDERVLIAEILQERKKEH